MMRVRFEIDGDEWAVPLAEGEVRIGRSSENDIVLPDFSVSRRHAILKNERGDWRVSDLGSTNGVLVNGQSVQEVAIQPGDRLKVGTFELRVEPQLEDASEPPPSSAVAESIAGPPTVPLAPAGPESIGSALSNATIIRSLSEFTADYGLVPEDQDSGEASFIRKSKREALDQAYASQVFGFLTRLARLLNHAEMVDEVLETVMEIAFEALPVDRGFILFKQDQQVVCRLMRHKERVHFRPQTEVPLSQTMLQAVMSERVALLTYDAQSDQRLAGNESVRIHQIRAAMCAPLWSGEKIIGVIQVDSPHHVGSFTEQDLDFLTALANYSAVAIERIRNARQVELERHVRSRLERYHSPAVIEEVMQQEEVGMSSGLHRLRRADVTVLFCDLVGFTAFSEHAEPEQVAVVMEAYFTHAVEAIFTAGGTLDKFIGDCVMAFFGAPMPQADHARRAVEAAIGIQTALERWNEGRPDGVMPLVTRIGINSGPVVVGDIGSNRRVDYTVLGNAVNVAARLESSVCQPGEVVVGKGTFEGLGNTWPTEPLGELQLKGLQRRIAAYRVLRRRMDGDTR